MNDLAICKRIAEIEGHKTLPWDEYQEGDFYIVVNDCGEQYDPLTNDALCFQLMVKYKVFFTPIPNLEKYSAAIWHNDTNISYGKDKSPSKAICLCIIGANK